VRLKSCPRCRGDVVTDRDLHGWYEQCLQCGYQLNLKSVAEVREQFKLVKNVTDNVRRKKL